MTTATQTPFVNTPQGVGVFECGTRLWIRAEDCQLDVKRPDWYEAPDLRDVPGSIGGRA